LEKADKVRMRMRKTGKRKIFRHRPHIPPREMGGPMQSRSPGAKSKNPKKKKAKEGGNRTFGGIMMRSSNEKIVGTRAHSDEKNDT